VVLAALEQRNKERILSGLPTYPSVEGMVESYMEFEGAAKGMSLLEAEDEVVRYLQRRAARRVDSGHPAGWGGGNTGPVLSRGAAQRFSGHRGGCGSRLWPTLWPPGIAVWHPTLLDPTPRPAPTLPLPLPLPLPHQALLDEGGLDGDPQEYFTRRST
jgi:hypothetical protein